MKNSFKYAIILLGLVVSGIIFLLACENGNEPDVDNIPNLRSLSSEEKEVIQSSNNFSLDIFSKVNSSHTGENIFISPFSISTALSMTLNGASEETLQAMKETLGLVEMTTEEINTAYRDLVVFLLQLDKKVNLQVANSNWYRQNLTIKSEFEAILQEYYDAEVKAADFTDPNTKDLVNEWIENKTNGKIKDMLDRIPPEAVMYLINAVYFKAEWKYQFDKNKTQDRSFHLASGSIVNVPTMYSKGVGINYTNKDGLKFIDIPYGNGQFNFSILVPDNYETDINSIIETLDYEQLNSYLEDTISYNTELYLPKIKIEFKKELKDILSDMGMAVAFSDGANFSNLFNEDLDLAISRVLHQSFLEVNEEGSEAAAATIVEIVETSAGLDKPPVIAVDRPFAFLIREKHSNTILFAGKVLNPI